MLRCFSIVGLVVACTPPASPTLPQQATSIPPPKAAVADVGRHAFDPPPRPEPAAPPTFERYGSRDVEVPNVRRTRDEEFLEGRWRKVEQPNDVAEIDFLARCARDFVQTQPVTARRALVDVYTHYMTTCDAEGKVVLERPLGYDSRDRRTRSDVSLVGTIGPRGAGIALRVASCGAEGSYDRLTIVAERDAWTSPRLEVRRDAYGCDIAELPYTRSLAKMLRLAIAVTGHGRNGALVRFDGSGNEISISDATRDEIRSVLDAVDAVTVL